MNSRALALSLLFVFPAIAQSDVDALKVHDLHLVSPKKSDVAYAIESSFRLEGDFLIVHFDVKSPTINTKADLDPKKDNLYSFDVVEIFVAAAGDSNHLPYYELEVSPLNQSLQVKVVNPKTKFIDNFETGFTHTASTKEGGWEAELSIPLKGLGWKGDSKKIFGNTFAILGPKGQRTYWSQFTPKQTKPNFHKPEFFKALLP